MPIIDRVRNICISPATEWPVIAQERSEPADVTISYLVPLAAANAIAGFIGGTLLRAILPFGGIFGGFVAGLVAACVSFVMTILAILVTDLLKGIGIGMVIGLYFVVRGKVKTFKSNDDGKELTIGLYKEGDFFGYIALLENAIYKETAEAMEDTEIAVIPREDFESLINNNPEVTRKFIRMLANNVSEKEDQLLGLAYNSLRKRVADALITLQRKYSKPGQETFSIHISREDLANIAGTATESLIRTLSDFRGEKLIEIKDGLIYIINEKKLSAMLN